MHQRFINKQVTGKRKNDRTTINIHDKTDSFATT
jgi:hypothetical protein